MISRFLWTTRDRHPGYRADLHIPAPADPKPLRAGFGQRDITPDVSDPSKPVWLAGFSQGRSATNVHDPLMAVAIALDDGHHRLAVVSIDSIGIFHDDVVRLRKSLPAELRLDHVTLCSTHNHSANTARTEASNLVQSVLQEREICCGEDFSVSRNGS
jgi:hypothetical protein